jgi:hypothetical protein
MMKPWIISEMDCETGMPVPELEKISFAGVDRSVISTVFELFHEKNGHTSKLFGYGATPGAAPHYL